jgi:fructose-bisphosphate aldolase, class I
MMLNDKVTAQLAKKSGFLAALDQSGGSTPSALKAYGITETAYSGEAEMYKLMHAMRVRIISAPAFTGDKVIAAILFERTMDGEAHGKLVPTYLWQDRGVVPLLKVDKGLADERDGVQVMKPMPDLDVLLARAVKLGVYGTKMRSVIKLASTAGIAGVIDQQFQIAAQIAKHGLIPIIEPEVSIKSPNKASAETILRAEIEKHLDADPAGFKVMLKLTIPNEANLYESLSQHDRVVRVVALSGGYTRDDACAKLSHNKNMIASFSRALVEDLTCQMSDADFDKSLARSIDEIFKASTVKV